MLVVQCLIVQGWIEAGGHVVCCAGNDSVFVVMLMVNEKINMSILCAIACNTCMQALFLTNLCRHYKEEYYYKNMV